MREKAFAFPKWEIRVGPVLLFQKGVVRCEFWRQWKLGISRRSCTEGLLKNESAVSEGVGYAYTHNKVSL